jgi:hypothetical protein
MVKVLAPLAKVISPNLGKYIWTQICMCMCTHKYMHMYYFKYVWMACSYNMVMIVKCHMLIFINK